MTVHSSSRPRIELFPLAKPQPPALRRTRRRHRNWLAPLALAITALGLITAGTALRREADLSRQCPALRSL